MTAARLRLACVFAHPDDETLGMGGTLARCAAEGIETYVVTATRGQRGRYGPHRDGPEHPGPEALGRIREGELRSACAVLGVREVTVLDHMDGELDRADPARVVLEIAEQLRRIRPQVVATFAPDGGYGHPDHVAICQLATAAVVRAAEGSAASHAVSKLYYLAWSERTWAAYQAALKKLVSLVDGVERQAAPWPDWAITTALDTREHWPTVWRAVRCHESQISIYAPLAELPEEHHAALWGVQEFYRAMSLVNGGRRRENDLFEGLR